MPETPPLRAYCVTLVFGATAGTIHMGTAFAPAPADATAVVLWNIMKHTPPEEDLAGSACVELPAEWLRHALQAIETGKPGAEVLSLVPKPPEGDAA